MHSPAEFAEPTSLMAQRAIRLRAEPPATREVTKDGNSSGHCLGQSTLAILPIRTPNWKGGGGGVIEQRRHVAWIMRIKLVVQVPYSTGQGSIGEERTTRDRT